MKWFKHYSDASDDEIMADMIDKFGPESYGVWWIILEMIAKQMDETDKCSVTYPLRKWTKNCGIFPKKLNEIVKFLSFHQKISTENSKTHLTVSCPKLLKIRDEYTTRKPKKSGQTPDNVPIKEGEGEVDKEKDKEIEKKGSVSIPYREIINLWNSICLSFPKINLERFMINNNRKKKVFVRYNQDPNLKYWEDVFRKAEESSFCKNNTWFSFDWIFKNETNHQKVFEGNYKNKDKPTKDSPEPGPGRIHRAGMDLEG